MANTSIQRVRARMESNTNVDISSPEFKTDDFRMYGLKVIECSRRYSHDWTTCPFAHPNEKARRRDPRKFSYTGVACPFIKQDQNCPYGEHCPYAHNVFEYWLHPSRYRTQLCNIAASCNRNVCFFAHTIEELRVPIPVGNPVSLIQPPPQQPVNPFAHGSTELPGMAGSSGAVDTASALPFAPQARYILEQLMASRQMSAELHASNSPMSDLSEIQTLIQLLQRQQILAGVSDQNPELQLNFLNSLFQALSNEMCTVLLQPEERERLTKLINWMYVQLVQNRQSLFSGTDSSTPFGPQQAEVLQDPILRQLGDALGRRHSLGRIPETAEANLMSPPLIRSSQDLSLGRHVSLPNLDRAQLMPFMRSASLDSRTPGFGGVGFGRDLRMSDESSVTRMSRTSGSASVNRSSADSEIFNRRSGNVVSQESSRMSWDEQPPEFILHDWLNQEGKPPPPSGSSA